MSETLVRVLFVDEAGKVRAYERRDLRLGRKFLFWPAQDEETRPILVVGAQAGSHHHLYLAVIDRDDVPASHLLAGAGDIAGDEVEGWASAGYSLVTPHSLRPLILAALGV